MNRETIKLATRRLGLYPIARSLFLKLDTERRQERARLRRFFGELIRPGDLCFDIGANLGQTIEALDAHGARVVALEPNPSCLPTLNWQFGRNPRVTLVTKAVGAAPGTAVLNCTGTDSTASMRDDWHEGRTDKVTVELTTLDALIAEFGVPKLCKVDVEGFETEVFQGLNQPIPLIYFEVHAAELDRARQILARFSQIGTIQEANLTDADHHGWRFDRWVSTQELSDGLASRLPGPYGNVVVRMTT